MSRRPRRHHSPEQKAALVRRKAVLVRRHLVDKVAVSQICNEANPQPSMFCDWPRQFAAHAHAALAAPARSSRERELEAKVAALEARLAVAGHPRLRYRQASYVAVALRQHRPPSRVHRDDRDRHERKGAAAMRLCCVVDLGCVGLPRLGPRSAGAAHPVAKAQPTLPRGDRGWPSRQGEDETTAKTGTGRK